MAPNNEKRSRRGGGFRRRTSHVLLMCALALLVSLPAAAQQDGGVTAGGEPAVEWNGAVSGSLWSQYLWRGRDYTLASAPVSVARARVEVASRSGIDLSGSAEARVLAAVARRGAPWEAAAADTVQLAAGGAALVRDGRIAFELGATVSVYAGAWRAGGAAPGVIGLEPYGAVSFPSVAGRPRFSGVVDLTPDQIGWRSGFEWFPAFDVGWGTLDGYVGVFRPHNYFKQKSRSFLGELLRGQPLTALVSLIPSDLTVGIRTLLAVTPALTLEPAAELLLVLNRPQNPAQIVPAAAVAVHYGRPEAIPRVHDGR